MYCRSVTGSVVWALWTVTACGCGSSSTTRIEQPTAPLSPPRPARTLPADLPSYAKSSGASSPRPRREQDSPPEVPQFSKEPRELYPTKMPTAPSDHETKVDTTLKDEPRKDTGASEPIFVRTVNALEESASATAALETPRQPVTPPRKSRAVAEVTPVEGTRRGPKTVRAPIESSRGTPPPQTTANVFEESESDGNPAARPENQTTTSESAGQVRSTDRGNPVNTEPQGKRPFPGTPASDDTSIVVEQLPRSHTTGTVVIQKGPAPFVVVILVGIGAGLALWILTSSRVARECLCWRALRLSRRRDRIVRRMERARREILIVQKTALKGLAKDVPGNESFEPVQEKAFVLEAERKGWEARLDACQVKLQEARRRMEAADPPSLLGSLLRRLGRAGRVGKTAREETVNP